MMKKDFRFLKKFMICTAITSVILAIGIMTMAVLVIESVDEDIDECAGNPCQNGGRCRNGINNYTCACAPGYTGRDCETAIKEASSGESPYSAVTTSTEASSSESVSSKTRSTTILPTETLSSEATFALIEPTSTEVSSSEYPKSSSSQLPLTDVSSSLASTTKTSSPSATSTSGSSTRANPKRVNSTATPSRATVKTLSSKSSYSAVTTSTEASSSESVSSKTRSTTILATETLPSEAIFALIEPTPTDVSSSKYPKSSSSQLPLTEVSSSLASTTKTSSPSATSTSGYSTRANPKRVSSTATPSSATRIPVVVKSNKSGNCLQSQNSSFLSLSSGCSGNSFLWNYTQDGLLKSLQSQSCLGFDGKPKDNSAIKNYRCNSTDQNQQWICVGYSIKMRNTEFYLKEHAHLAPPILVATRNDSTRWINPATSGIICD